LVVFGPLNGNTQLNVAGDHAEVCRLGVRQGEPLMLDGMVVCEVDLGQIELVHADELVLENTLVFYFDLDIGLFNDTRML